MHLYSFAYAQPDHFVHLAKRLGESVSDTKQQVFNLFTEAYDNGNILYFQGLRAVGEEAEADRACFLTPYFAEDGEPLWLHFQPNRNKDAQRWYWEGYISQYELFSQLLRSAHFVIGDLVFNSAREGCDFLRAIKDEAQSEPWDFPDSKSTIVHPILKSYIEHTYWRLRHEDQVEISLNGKQALFNTGLLEKAFLRDILILCDRETIQVLGSEYPIYRNARLVLEGDSELAQSFSNPRPPLPQYFSNMDEIVYDPEVTLGLKVDHIFKERADRIMEAIAGKYNYDINTVYSLFEGRKDRLSKLAQRNYKLVVPQFYRGSVQFLFPVYLQDPCAGRPDFTLALSRTTDAQGNRAFEATTVLTVEMAYNNARLLAKPDSPWLTEALSDEEEVA